MLGECDEGAGEKKGIQKESDKVESETKKMKRGWEDPALKVGRGSAPENHNRNHYGRAEEGPDRSGMGKKPEVGQR